MNKKKLLLALSLTLALTACSDDNYVSKRHPEGEVREVTEEDMQVDNSQTTDDQTNESTEEETEANQTQDEEVVDDGINYTVENTVNVRVAPSETSNVMTTVEAGDDILKLGESDNWTRISIDGQTGYIRSDLLVAK